jgi:hypothetical protein
VLRTKTNKKYTYGSLSQIIISLEHISDDLLTSNEATVYRLCQVLFLPGTVLGDLHQTEKNEFLATRSRLSSFQSAKTKLLL